MSPVASSSAGPGSPPWASAWRPSSLLVRTALAASGAKVLVKVFLRGGADGLNLCAPYGDAEYYNLRQGIALPRPGQAGGVVNLDGYFGMHPEFAPLESLLPRRPARLRPRGRQPAGDALALRRPGLPGVGDAGRQADAHRLARPGDRADPGHRGDPGRLVLVAARALAARAGAGAGGADAHLVRPARAQLAERGRDAAHGDVPGRTRPRSAPSASRRSRRLALCCGRPRRRPRTAPATRPATPATRCGRRPA